MLTIVCGEDSVAARDHYRDLIEEARGKNFEVTSVAASDVLTTIKPQEAATTLFGLRQVYITQGLNRLVGRGKGDAVMAHLTQVAAAPGVELITFEDGVGGFELKLRGIGMVKEFKLSDTIFKLLDMLVPKNLPAFVGMLETIPGPDIFILVMLQRHVRKLLLVASGQSPKGLASWQIGRLKAQAGQWDIARLTSFYDAIIRIEMNSKSGINPLGTKSAVEVAAAYLL